MRILAEILLFLTRHYPLTRGRNFLMRNGDWLRRMSTKAPCDLETRAGFRILTNTKLDYVSCIIKIWGEYEPKTQAFLTQHMRDGDLFLDVGANIGYFSLLVAHRCPASQIIAFEPNIPLAALLEASAFLNDFSQRLSVKRLAVSNYTGTIGFAVNEANTGLSKVVHTDAAATTAPAISCVSLDEWFPAQGIEKRIGLIKIDIEGAELFALEGMKTLLASHKPILIVEGCEENLKSFDSSVAKLRSLLQSLGYQEIAPYDENLYLAMGPT